MQDLRFVWLELTGRCTLLCDHCARFRGWMRELLAQAAEHFSLTLLGDLTFGWRDRSIGSRVRGVDGDRWLRVITSHNTWANGEFWTGNLDAAAIHGVPKPCVLQVREWTEGPGVFGLN